MQGRAQTMLKYAEERVERAPVIARPQPQVDRKALRAEINKRFSKTLEYLAK
jgi:hypothetical protein